MGIPRTGEEEFLPDDNPMWHNCNFVVAFVFSQEDSLYSDDHV
jgi:hypothetical protein